MVRMTGPWSHGYVRGERLLGWLELLQFPWEIQSCTSVWGENPGNSLRDFAEDRQASEVDTNGAKSFGFHSLCLWPTGPHWPIILLQSVLVKQLQIWTRTRDRLLGVPCLWFFLEVTSNRRESSSKSCQLRTSKNLLCCKYYLGSTFTSPLFFSLSFPLLLSLPSAGFWLHWP